MLVQRSKIEDSRGFLSRLYCAEIFRNAGINKGIAQINHTSTKKKGTVRGMHYQSPPYSECKIISCLSGEIFDVAVDLRRYSPTFLQWHAEVLSAENQRSLLIPEGFAHGFQTLTEDCDLIYLHTHIYEPSAEAALNARDPQLSITWPLEITEISERDRNHAFLANEYEGIVL